MLRRAINSCAKQTVPCEIVVVDEASTDNTAEVIEGVPGLKYIRHDRPLGHSAAANCGIREAGGEWIKPLDDDDWLAPDCVEKMTAAIESASDRGLCPVMISGRAVNVDEAGRELGQTSRLAPVLSALQSKDLLRLMMFDLAPIGTPIQVGHKRETALRVGGWNERRAFDHQHGDEAELWIKLAGRGDCVFIPAAIAYRTLWPGGSQERIPPVERYRSNLFLKELIGTELGERFRGASGVILRCIGPWLRPKAAAGARPPNWA